MAQKTTPKKKAAQRKPRAKKLTMHQKLDMLAEDVGLIASKMKTLSAWETFKGKEWHPKVGDYVVPLVPLTNGVDQRGMVVKLIAWDGEDSDAFATEGNNWYAPEDLRPALPAEIEAYEVSQEKGVLEKGEACECTDSEMKELMAIARGGGLKAYEWGEGYAGLFMGMNGDLYPFQRGSTIDERTYGEKTATPLFKKKLLNTISAKKIEEEQRVVELQEGDSCARNLDLLHDLRNLGLPTYHTALSSDGDCEILEWSQGKLYRVAHRNGLLTPMEFLRRAQGTADRLNKLEAEKERNRPLVKGMKVHCMLNHFELLTTEPNAEGNYFMWRMTDTYGQLHAAKRDQFTILTP